MADFEKVEFEFPHENEEKNSRAGGKVVNLQDEDKPIESDETEIEIVDDVPSQDRNRKPMDEAPKDMGDDELAKYDEGVRKRIQHFTKGYHEERRAKESAERLREEALRFAQQMAEENKKLKGSLSQGQLALIEQAKKVVANEMSEAKSKYKAAYESGDSDALVAAQEEMTSVKMKLDRVSNFKPAPAPDDSAVQLPESLRQQPAKQSVDKKALEWQSRNKWFGQDRRMTSYALALHEDLTQEERINPSSDKYYERIDAEMRQRFSDRFESEKLADAPTSPRTSNVVAPATRGTAPRKVVLTKSQVEIAKRLGVPLELYARKVAEDMRK
jgi:hypothetical protein